ncbi:hypothetical protein DENIS_3111 [Desulfonema ishimotonii]|uniref:Type VI secretion system component TssM1 N-terminal domain-containing protein n=1 Tax=Desulfonema ishimotonii TaxID=45657 RepID=A0A401FYU6_9BACT|nr:type VI secretion system protein [Desulfonema ishimotonii]GBC62148.1 hypothetical protein DENIS_3111 [Desulfonema ishimotonii]
MGKIKRLLLFLLAGILLGTFWLMEKTPHNLLMGVIAVILLILLFIFLIFRAAAKAPTPDMAPPPLSPPPEPPEKPSDTEDAGRIPSGAKLRKSFARAVKSLKNNVSGRDYRYQIPWFLMLGQTEAGKTELLKHIGLNPLFDRRIEEYRASEDPPCNWWLFERGVVIDVAGEMVLQEEDDLSDRPIGRLLPGRLRRQLSGGRMWRLFLSLLQKYRPDRPIDGVILTLPCTAFMGFGSEAHERQRIREKADLLYRRLWHAQKVLGIRFPVYVLVTQCDRISGFTDFCRAMPSGHLRDQIFGWSSPYTVETAYAGEWGQQAFRAIRQQLFETQFEMFAEGTVPGQTDPQNGGPGDDFFLFPSNFQALEAPMRICLDHLFRQSVYHQSFVFRGIYFCGRGAEPAPEPESAGLRPFEKPRQEESDAEAAGLKPFFVKELLEKKIFPEHGVARPLTRAIITRNRKELVFQVLTVLFILIAGIGLWRDYKQFRKDHRAVRAFLEKVDENLDDLSIRIRTNSKKELVRYVLEQESVSISFNENALRLSGELASVNELRFAFIPSSWLWFGSVHETIGKSVGSAYDQIILKAMFIQLVQKAESIVEPRRMGPVITDGQKFRYSLEEIPAFYHLAKFTRDLQALEKHIRIYNGLAESKNYLYEFGQVVEYLFGIRLRESFYVRSRYYSQARQEAGRWSFDPEITKIFRVKASKFTIDRLARRFPEDFSESDPVDRRLQTLSEALEDFSRMGRQSVRNDRPVRELLGTISATEALLLRERYQWLAWEKLAQAEPFERLLNEISQSAFLGQPLSDKVRVLGEEGFAQLREKLKSRQAALTGPLLARQADNIRMQLSDDVIEFRSSLEKLLGYDFMSARRDQFRDVRTCSDGTRLEWNINLLRDTVKSLEDYERFIRNEYREYSPALQKMVLRVAKSRMDREVQGRIAGAQTCEPLSDRFLRQHRETVISSEIVNFKDASRLLSRLRADCGRLDLTDAHVVLSELLRWQANHLLTAIDNILSSENLYTVRGGDFSWWDGTGPALSLAAFDVVDQNELAYYLQLQRNRVRHLAYEYAEPVITLFISNRMDELTLNKWKRILSQVQAYESKKPGNSVTALEKFVLFELDHISDRNYREKIPPARLNEGSGDIFLEARNALRRKLYARCQRLAAKTLMADYATLREFFNRKLAGRFPFAAITPQTAWFAEAEPQDIRDFYRLLDRRLKDNRDLFVQDHLFGVSGGHVYDFLKKTERLRGLFSGYLDEPAEAPSQPDEAEEGKAAEKKKPEKDGQPEYPALDFDIEFRVNRNHEKLANRIIGWTFTVGDQVFRYGGPKKTGRWHWGEPVSLSLRWPRNYPGYPVLPGNRPGLTLDGKTVTWTFSDPWALLRLLRLHAATPGDFDTPEAASPHTLKFEVSTVHVDLNEEKKEKPDPQEPPNTRVYLRLNLITPDKNKTMITTMPVFPVKAPELKWRSTDGGVYEPEYTETGSSPLRIDG